MTVLYRNGKSVASTESSGTIYKNGKLANTAPNTIGVVGQLDGLPNGWTKDSEISKSEQEAYLAKCLAEFNRFKADYPQVILDRSESGIANNQKFQDWLAGDGEVPVVTYKNLVTCLNNFYRGIIFNPALIGINKYGPRLEGSEAEAKMTSVDFEKLLSPFRGARVNPDSLLTSEQFRAAHPKAFAGVAGVN
jgi:hypothetical protein